MFIQLLLSFFSAGKGSSLPSTPQPHFSVLVVLWYNFCEARGGQHTPSEIVVRPSTAIFGVSAMLSCHFHEVHGTQRVCASLIVRRGKNQHVTLFLLVLHSICSVPRCHQILGLQLVSWWVCMRVFFSACNYTAANNAFLGSVCPSRLPPVSTWWVACVKHGEVYRRLRPFFMHQYFIDC